MSKPTMLSFLVATLYCVAVGGLLLRGDDLAAGNALVAFAAGLMVGTLAGWAEGGKKG